MTSGGPNGDRTEGARHEELSELSIPKRQRFQSASSEQTPLVVVTETYRAGRRSKLIVASSGKQ